MVYKVGREPDPAKRIRQRFGSQIQTLRKFRKMSVTDLARAITERGAAAGVSLTVTPAAVVQWETGKTSPRPVMQIAIAEALETTWLSIFSLEGETLR